MVGKLAIQRQPVKIIQTFKEVEQRDSSSCIPALTPGRYSLLPVVNAAAPP